LKILIFILPILLFYKINLLAEDFYLQHREIFAIEVKSGTNFDFHSIDENILFNDEKASNFKSKLKVTPIIMFVTDYSITNKIHCNISMSSSKSKSFFQAENYFFTRDDTSPELTKVTTKEVYNYSFNIYSISAGLSYEIFPRVINGPLKIGVGFNSNFLNNEFLYYEEILNPQTSVFVVDGKTTRRRDLKRGEDKLLNNFALGFSLSLDHFLKISRNMFFTQSVSYSQYLQSISKEYDWDLKTLSFTLGLRISLIKEMSNPLEP